jgi:hypothetical protein
MSDPDALREARFIELLGLDRWFVGVNTFRTSDGDVPVWVDHLWTFWGWPSFDGWWHLAGVSARPHKKSGTLTRVAWLPETDAMPIKGEVTSLGVSADLAADSFLEAVNSIRPFGTIPGGGWLDGISYVLWYDGCDMAGQLRFGNPERADLIAVERTAFELARQLGEATGSPALKESLEVWEQYRIGRTG